MNEVLRSSMILLQDEEQKIREMVAFFLFFKIFLGILSYDDINMV